MPCSGSSESGTFPIRGPSWPLSTRAPRVHLTLQRCQRRFCAGVERREALDILASNPALTLVVDLAAGDSPPVERRRRRTPAGTAGRP
jgi:hypothetical protein